MAAIIGVLTLTPSGSPASSGPGFCLICGIRALADTLLNVVLFLPLGAALFAVSRSVTKAALACATFSAAIELAQLAWIPGRDSNPSDFIFNSLGGFLGALIVLTAPWWMAGSARRRRRLAAALLTTTLAALTEAALLLAPHLPERAYFGQWTPRLDNLEWYRGQVLAARIGGVPVPSTRFDDSEALRTLLDNEAPIEVVVVAGPPVTGLAPIFSIADDYPSSIRLIGIDRDDGVFRFKTLSTSILLDEPSIRLHGAFADVAQGDTIRIAVRHSGDSFCIDIASYRQCGVGYRLADTWGVLSWPGSWPEWLMNLTGLGWLAGIFSFSGFFLSGRKDLIGAAAVVAAALFVIPLFTPVMPVTALEIAAGMSGLFIGMAVRRFVDGAHSTSSGGAAPLLPI
jgi:hypothetical protein